MHARFPVPSAPVDQTLVQAAQYVVDALHEFRLKKIANQTPAKVKTAVPPKPTHATIWIAETYPPWQDRDQPTYLYNRCNQLQMDPPDWIGAKFLLLLAKLPPPERSSWLL